MGAEAVENVFVSRVGRVAVLALGVGANLAEFQIFDAMVLHRLHFRDANAFLQFSHVSRQGRRLGFPSGAVEFYRSGSRSFAWLVCEEYLDVVLEGGLIPIFKSKLESRT